MNYSPLHIYLQPTDDFGMEQGEARQTLNEALVYAQVGEVIKNPQVVSDNEPESLPGEWKVQDKEWAERENGTHLGRQLTIFIRQP